MLFCCRNGTCRACKTERRLAGAAVVALVAFTVADNTHPDLQLLPPLTTAVTAPIPAGGVVKLGQRLDGTTPPLPAVAAAQVFAPPAAPVLRRETGSINLRTSIK